MNTILSTKEIIASDFQCLTMFLSANKEVSRRTLSFACVLVQSVQILEISTIRGLTSNTKATTHNSIDFTVEETATILRCFDIKFDLKSRSVVVPATNS